MKKLICIITIVMLATLTFSLMAGCANDNGEPLLECTDENFGKYNGKVVSDMSAFDLVMDAYSNFIKEDNYIREEYFAFKSSVADRHTHLIRKIVDGKVYNQEVIVGTGFDKGTCAKRFYYDGAQANSINNTNTRKNNITFKKSTNEFIVKDWGEFAPFTGDLDKELKELREKITTYNIMSRDMLSPTHNDKVYEKGGVFYCQIKIDCSKEKMTGVQRAALEEFLDTLSAKEEGFSIDDTTIDFAISNIEGKNKFVIWRRNEKYAGKHSTGIKVSCRQECLSYYTYGNAVITDEDLLNLA